MSISHLTNPELFDHYATTTKEIEHLKERIEYLKSPRFPADSSTPATIRAYDKMLTEAHILHDRLAQRISDLTN